MTDLIPAAPGWYVESDLIEALDPVVAWSPTVDSNETPVLLPYVDGGVGFPPFRLSLKDFDEGEWRTVYRPNHDPAQDA
ncbi:hypothetical protein ABT234_20905 [Streptomyces sp. NPDC001586]|uniref:hypothetical protein n=1 Tax=Streptomyces sp. NPDC001586 TaxID=3154387 RepID=UPI003326DDBC